MVITTIPTHLVETTFEAVFAGLCRSDGTTLLAAGCADAIARFEDEASSAETIRVHSAGQPALAERADKCVSAPFFIIARRTQAPLAIHIVASRRKKESESDATRQPARRRERA
jgi:hypothetical protein